MKYDAYKCLNGLMKVKKAFALFDIHFFFSEKKQAFLRCFIKDRLY